MYHRKLISIMIIITVLISMLYINEAKKKKGKGKRRKVFHGPHGMGINESTSCDEFSKNARFNPYSVVDETWFVFYYWSYPLGIRTYRFLVPTANYTKALHKNLDGNVSVPVNWTARQLLMRDNMNYTSFLVERNHRGYYWQYLYEYTEDGLMEPRDIRFKQTGDGRILGMMDCKDESVYVMSRINEVPPKDRLQDEASRLGYRCRRGKSYLYQGHEWLPIEEDEEEHYWARHPRQKYPDYDDPKTQRVLKEIEKHRIETATGEYLRESDLEGRKDLFKGGTLQYTQTTDDQSDSKSSKDPANERKANNVEGSQPISETDDLQISDTISNTDKEPVYTDSLTKAISDQKLTETENLYKLDSSDSVNAKTLIISDESYKQHNHLLPSEEAKDTNHSDTVNDVTQSQNGSDSQVNDKVEVNVELSNKDDQTQPIYDA